MDADLRRPTLNQHFGLQKTPGLSDLIVGKSAASQAIQSTRINGLQLLACGYQPPNPAELLGSPMMKQILDAIRAHYDWVLIDAPPLLAMADAPVLCSLVEGVVLVLAAEVATKPAVMRAIDQVQGVGGKVIGRRAQQGQPGAELLLLQPVLRRVLPELLRRGGVGPAVGGRGAAQDGPAAAGAAGPAGLRRAG